MTRVGLFLAVTVSALLVGLEAHSGDVCPQGATYSNNGKVSGCLHAGVRVGVWAMRDGKQNVLQEVTYNDEGEQDGVARSFYPNGELKEESFFEHNRASGTWTVWYENAQKKESRSYVDGELHGPREMWDENGSPSGLKCFVRGKPRQLDECNKIEVAEHRKPERAPASVGR